MEETLIQKIIKILEEAVKNGGMLSYQELSVKLSVPEKDIKNAVRQRFVELTKKAYNPFKDAEPTFYLLGDHIWEISTDKEYQKFKEAKMKQLERMGKANSTLRRI